MQIFYATLNQTAFLFGLIAIGFLLVKCKALPQNAASILSKLENNVFIPALVMGTFMENFTVDRIRSAWKLLLISFIIAFVAIPFSFLISKLVSKDSYTQKIYTYGLSFSNFGFMGNAVVSSLFPDLFFEYLIFTLPLWILIYLWGVPELLIADSGKRTLKDRVKSFANPMFIGMVIGMIIGLLRIPLPQWTTSIISVCGSCMSPIAMLLTGIVVSCIPLKKTFTDLKIYVISAVKLVVMPLILIAVSFWIPIPRTIFICALCSLAMPMGLNTIVIPSAYGRDTSVGAGISVISHLFSVITIPLIFLLMSN